MKLFCKILVVLGGLGFAGGVVLAFIYGFTSGNIIAFVAAAALGGFGWFYDRLPLWVKWTAAAGAVFVVVMIAVIAVDGQRLSDTVTGREDYVLVLGGGIRGETVLPVLAARLDRCLDYMERNPSAIVVVSGGQGSHEAISEAAAMKKYLVARGIDASQIVEEGRSRDTRQNMLFSKEIFDSLAAAATEAGSAETAAAETAGATGAAGATGTTGTTAEGRYSVACVSSRSHLMRSAALARDTGLDARTAGAAVPWYLCPATYLREVLSVIKYWFEK